MCEVYEFPEITRGWCDCGTWSSHLQDGECPHCLNTNGRKLAQVFSIARAARGDDTDPLDGGPDDDPPNPPAA